MATWMTTCLFVCLLSRYLAVPFGKDPVRQVNFDHASINNLIMNIAWPDDHENRDASSKTITGSKEIKTKDSESLGDGNKYADNVAALNSSMEFLRRLIISANTKLDQLLESGDENRDIIAKSKTQTGVISNKLDEMISRLNKSEHEENIMRAINNVKAQITEVLREREDNGTDNPIEMLNVTLVRLQQSMDKLLENVEVHHHPRDCSEVFKRGYRRTGVYSVWPQWANEASRVFCEMSDVKWTVLMRRVSGSVNFNREWDVYKFGFGDPISDYWAGNEFIHFLTNQANYKLRIDFKLWATGGAYYAEYTLFKVAGEDENYRLTIGDESGTANMGGMTTHNSMMFSTKDKDNDQAGNACAVRYSGGWWYKNCHTINLMGPYTNRCYETCSRWYNTGALKEISMKVTAK